MDTEEQIMSEVVSSAAATKEEAPSQTPESTPEVSEPEVEVTAKETKVSEPQEDFYKKQYENLQKDYTRKSQRLAEYEKSNSEPEPEPDPEWTKPEWQPKTWQEAIEAGKQAALKEVAPMLSQYQQEQQRQQLYTQAQAQAEQEMAEIKTQNPKINENLIYQHATKYGFTKLKDAYANLMDMQAVQKSAQDRVLKDLKNRQADPVSVSGATTPEDDTPSYQEISGYKSIRSAASAAFSRIKGN